MIWEPPSLVCRQWEWNLDPHETATLPCSLRCCSEWPGYGKTLSALPQTGADSITRAGSGRRQAGLRAVGRAVTWVS